MRNYKIHYGIHQRLDLDAIGTLNDEGLHSTAKLCNERHSKISLPDVTFDKKIVTCKRCLKKLAINHE